MIRGKSDRPSEALKLELLFGETSLLASAGIPLNVSLSWLHTVGSECISVSSI